MLFARALILTLLAKDLAAFNGKGDFDLVQEGMDTQSTEKRKSQRFHPNERSFAVIGPDSGLLGEIMDISIDGLAFRYIGDRGVGPNKEGSLDILLADRSMFIQGLSYKLVTDSAMIKEYPSSLMTPNRCGVVFQDLSPRQEAQLEKMILSYCAGKPTVHSGELAFVE